MVRYLLNYHNYNFLCVIFHPFSALRNYSNRLRIIKNRLWAVEGKTEIHMKTLWRYLRSLSHNTL